MDISKFQGLEEIEFSELKCIFDGLVKNGDSEKFFSKYYAAIALESTRFFKDLPSIQLHCLQSKLLKTC